MSQLGTMWLGYIPSNLVDTLAGEIKATQSLFYVGVNNSVVQQLARLVNSGFNLVSVLPPTTGSGGNTPGSTGSSGSNNTRQDAIIGVVSALGAIALLVLAFLVYRSIKRKREMAHRRLSDPGNTFVGARPEGREFDEDSVGGARRRSFYYAEDSLRGFQGQGAEGAGPSMTNSRRAVVPTAISAPILRESSMNW